MYMDGMRAWTGNWEGIQGRAWYGIADDVDVSTWIELCLGSVYCKYFETLASNEEEHRIKCSIFLMCLMTTILHQSTITFGS